MITKHVYLFALNRQTIKSRNQLIQYCQELIIKTKSNYIKIKKVYCPTLKENVVFNAKGFHHILYESGGTPRTVEEKIYKLTLIPLAPAVIRNAIKIKGVRDVEVRVSRKNRTVLKKGKAYSLVATVGRKNPVAVRVILLRIGNGQLAFRSIMKNRK